MMDKLLTQLAVKLSADDISIPDTPADQVLTNGLNLVYFLAGLAAVIVIVVGGIMYATSTGDSGKITKAKNMILYAVVGLVIVLSAFAITNFVSGRFS